MRVSAAFLCDFAEVREGLLIAVAGGVTRVWRDEYPAQLGCMLAVLVNLQQAELGVPHDFEAVVVGPDKEIGKAVGGFHFPKESGADLKPGEELVAPLTLDFRAAPIPEEGSYTIHFTIDGDAYDDQMVSFVATPRPSAPA